MFNNVEAEDNDTLNELLQSTQMLQDSTDNKALPRILVNNIYQYNHYQLLW